MIKAVLLCVVFLCGSCVGVMISDRYKSRLRYFTDCILLCNHLKNNILLNKDKLSVVIESLKKQVYDTVYHDLILGVNHEKISVSYLQEDEKQKLETFYSVIGKNDIDGELNNINNMIAYLEQKQKMCTNDVSSKGKFASKIAIFISLGVVIILI